MTMKSQLLGGTTAMGTPKLLVSPTGHGSHDTQTTTSTDDAKFTPPTAESILHQLNRVQAKQTLTRLNGFGPYVWTDVACAVLRISRDEVTPEIRERAKMASYAWAFNATEKTLSSIFHGEDMDLDTLHPALKDVLENPDG